MLITSVDTNVFIAGKIYDVLYTWSLLLDKEQLKIIAMLYFNRSGKDNGAFIVERYKESLIEALHKHGIYENIEQDLQEIIDFTQRDNKQ